MDEIEEQNVVKTLEVFTHKKKLKIPIIIIISHNFLGSYRNISKRSPAFRAWALAKIA